MPKSPEARLAERLQIRGNRLSASVRFTEASSARLGASVDQTEARNDTLGCACRSDDAHKTIG
jgi:hypothetical protein